VPDGLITVEIESRGECLVARLEGEIDLSNADDVEQQLTRGETGAADTLVLDLSELRYLDSAGVAFLHRLARTRLENGQTLALVVSDASFVRRVLEVTRIDAVVPVAESIDAALLAS
jgi:anti-anti-sigma factor